MSLIDEIRAVHVPMAPLPIESIEEKVDHMFDNFIEQCKERSRNGFNNAVLRFSEYDEIAGSVVVEKLRMEGFMIVYDKKLAGDYFYIVSGWA